MIISRPKPAWTNAHLFERPVAGLGGIRNAVGDLAERLTASLVGGVRHRTDSTCDYCPDVSRCLTDDWSVPPGPEFFESKAVGSKREVFIYGGRLDRDQVFADAGHSLTYVVWHHQANTAGLETVEAVETAVLSAVRSVHVVPFTEIAAICRDLPRVKLNSKYGGSDSRPEYRSGVKFPLSRLEQWLHSSFPEGLRRVADVRRPETT